MEREKSIGGNIILFYWCAAKTRGIISARGENIKNLTSKLHHGTISWSYQIALTVLMFASSDNFLRMLGKTETTIID